MSEGLSLTAGEASQKLEARLIGDASFVIEGVAAPETALPSSVCFIESESYLSGLKTSRARSWIVSQKVYESLDAASKGDRVFFIAEKPYHSFVKLMNHFFPQVASTGKKNERASIDPAAEVHPTAQIDPFVTIEAGARIGAGAILKAGVWIGEHAKVGENSILHSGVKVYPHCVVGKRNILHSGVVIGADGFGFLPDTAGVLKIPQVGRAVLHDDVEIGANSCVDRGTLGDTVIGRGTKIDNLVQVGHNCKIGMSCVLCAFVGLAGHTVLGNGVVMGGQSATKGHLKIGDGAQVGGQSGVSKDIPPQAQVKGYPAQPVKEFLKLQVLFTKLPEFYERLKGVEKRLDENESGD